ncbi:MAG: hypothetical protein CMC53_04745 [Flavobacteriaceae bacterium]|nr:hypothetical protein [Flavobacteriaceae bacterium]
MIQRIQTIYMLLLILLNIIVIIAIDDNPEIPLTETYFGFFRPYVTDYFFLEICSVLLIVNILLYRKPKIQINFLRVIIFALIFGLFNLFDERSFIKSLKDPTLFYFILSFSITLMSIKSIKKDISIIGSSNRIR